MKPSVLEPIAEFSIRADAVEVRRASTWMERTCRDNAVPASAIERLDICLNETLANIIMHGGDEALVAPVLLHLDVRRDGRAAEATLTVSDSGTAFDPLAAATGRPPATLSEAEPGGLGLTMIRSAADTLDYRYSEGRNRLSIGVSWPCPADVR